MPAPTLVPTKSVRQAIYEQLNQASLTTLLAGGSAGLVHDIGPATTARPICSYRKQSGITSMDVFGGDDARSFLWLVKGIAETQSAAEDIDAAASNLLHFGALTISAADHLFLARESDVEYIETSGDKRYRHVGGLYRVIAHAT